MTNQEAITWLTQLSAGIEWEVDISYAEAIDVAIEALKAQELSNDSPELDKENGELIRRKAAIDAFLTELTKRERKNLLHTWSTVEVKYFVVEMLEQLPSVQPEKTQLSEEDATSDCISRKAAISLPVKPKEDRYFQTQNLDDAYELGWFACQQCIEDLPPAQPETHEKRTETHACDLIDRLAAIDTAIEAADEWDGGYSRSRDEIITMKLRMLPSVQPETIRCKDCKYFEYDHPYVIQGVPVLGHEICNAWGDGCKTNENGYCFLAERRTDG